MLLISVSGLRGIIGEGLTAEMAVRYAEAFASTLDSGPVLVSRDSRPSGEMLRHAVIAGLMSAGLRVLDAGILPTPTCGFAVRSLRAAGGIQITASHNPAAWNGMKLIGADGAVLAATAGEQVRRHFEQGHYRRAAWDHIGTLQVPPAIGSAHLEGICEQVSVAAIAARRWRVLLDANGGAGGALGQQLLEQLGCEVVVHGGEMDGQFQHPPEPTPEHLAEVGPWVVHNQAALGLALDPDADRLALIDERGRCLSEELTLALAVEYLLRRRKGPVVINMSTSRVVEDIARRHHCPCYRAPVGEAHVVSRMRHVEAVIGGEGNGGVIAPQIGWIRDPFVAMAWILALLTEDNQPLSELVAQLPQYVMLKTRLPLKTDCLEQAYALMIQHWPQTHICRDDGLRLDADTWWLHLRPSNTEPIVRLIVESKTEQQARQLCEEVRQLLVPLDSDPTHWQTAMSSNSGKQEQQ
jgi:phosphomannomutase